MDWSLPHLRWTDLLDIVLVAAALWAAFLWVRRTRSRLALQGLLLLSGVYLLARYLELQLSLWILQGFFAVLVIVLVVVFQEDLKRIMEQLALWSLGQRATELPPDVGAALIRTVAKLARTRRGALIVLAGREPLDRHLEGGIEIDAKLSEVLLLSIFDPNSPGHDGAVVVQNGRLARFAVHLPLSSAVRVGVGGTRHAAALGLAERCDALCLVVSEERGTVSVARRGELVGLTRPEDLVTELHAFEARVGQAPRRHGGPWLSWVRRWPQALAALLVAAGLWIVWVPGQQITEQTYRLPIEIENLPADWQLLGLEPREVQVTLAGPQRYQDAAEVHVRLDVDLVSLGRRTFRLAPSNIERPPKLTLVRISPDRVRLDLVPRKPGASLDAARPRQGAR
jgi:diadenylate cyclase